MILWCFGMFLILWKKAQIKMNLENLGNKGKKRRRKMDILQILISKLGLYTFLLRRFIELKKGTRTGGSMGRG